MGGRLLQIPLYFVFAVCCRFSAEVCVFRLVLLIFLVHVGIQ